MRSPAFIHILRAIYAPGDSDLRVCWGVYSKCVKLWRQVVSKSLHRKDIGDFRHVQPHHLGCNLAPITVCLLGKKKLSNW